MSDWVDVATEQSFVPSEKLMFDLDDETRVIVLKIDGQFYAIDELCNHDHLSMEDGEIEGDEIICPFHGARFCLKSGEVKTPPAYENVTSFPARVENGMVQIRDPRWD